LHNLSATNEKLAAETFIALETAILASNHTIAAIVQIEKKKVYYLPIRLKI
jgi:hypothetical protein